jgi:hypothetical protein
MLKAMYQEKRPCSRQHCIRFVKLSLLCAAATVANPLLSIFVLHFLGFPLFMDTVFTVAVTFAAGLIPGLAVAVLSWIAGSIHNAYFHPFVAVAIAEVLLVYWLKPAPSKIADFSPGDPAFLSDIKIASKINTIARLTLLYLACVIALSVLGGIIGFLFYTVGGREGGFFHTIETFRTGFLRSGMHLLTADILSRILVNIADRFIVIFGGYLISLGIKRLSVKR